MDFGIKKVIGGFEVIKVKKGDFAFVKVSGLDGGWSMEYREDTMGFHMFDTVEKDEDWDALHVIMCNSFIVSTVFDAALQHDIVMAADAFSKRLVEESPKATEEEDAEILNQLRTEAEMYEELGATLDKADLTIPVNENVEATEAWSVEGGEEFEFKNE